MGTDSLRPFSNRKRNDEPSFLELLGKLDDPGFLEKVERKEAEAKEGHDEETRNIIMRYIEDLRAGQDELRYVVQAYSDLVDQLRGELADPDGQWTILQDLIADFDKRYGRRALHAYNSETPDYVPEEYYDY